MEFSSAQLGHPLLDEQDVMRVQNLFWFLVEIWQSNSLPLPWNICRWTRKADADLGSKRFFSSHPRQSQKIKCTRTLWGSSVCFVSMWSENLGIWTLLSQPFDSVSLFSCPRREEVTWVSSVFNAVLCYCKASWIDNYSLFTKSWDRKSLRLKLS